MKKNNNKLNKNNAVLYIKDVRSSKYLYLEYQGMRFPIIFKFYNHKLAYKVLKTIEEEAQHDKQD